MFCFSLLQGFSAGRWFPSSIGQVSNCLWICSFSPLTCLPDSSPASADSHNLFPTQDSWTHYLEIFPITSCVVPLAQHLPDEISVLHSHSASQHLLTEIGMENGRQTTMQIGRGRGGDTRGSCSGNPSNFYIGDPFHTANFRV